MGTSPLEVVETLTPLMSATTLLLSLASEELWVVLPRSPYFSSLPHAAVTLGIITLGATLAFLMVRLLFYFYFSYFFIFYSYYVYF